MDKYGRMTWFIPPRLIENIGLTKQMYIDPATASKRGTRTQLPSHAPSSAPTPSIPWHLLGSTPLSSGSLRSPNARLFSTTRTALRKEDSSSVGKHLGPPTLTHVSDSGSAHMVSISEKTPTKRVAVAKCRVQFSMESVAPLIRANQLKKGDVLGVARIAGIMAAKRTPDLIPLCHPIAISHVSVDLDVLEPREAGRGGESTGARESYGWVDITATVSCDGKTGVEMEALTAASTAALTVYDMCKAVDKGMVIEGLRVVLKDGGKSGRWVEGTSIE